MPITLAEIIRRLEGLRPRPAADVARIGAALVGDVSGAVRRAIRSTVPVGATEVVEDWFPWTRDERLALDPSVGDDDRMAALARLVATVRWSPNRAWGGREERAWGELRRRAADERRSIESIKQELLAEAALLVLADRARSRRIRVGSGKGSFGLTEVAGGSAEVSPTDLPFAAGRGPVGVAPDAFFGSPYLYWLRREIQKAATAVLLNEPYPPTDATADDALNALDSAPPPLDQIPLDDEVGDDPPSALLAAERYAEASRQLGMLLEQATPAQRELLRLLAAGATVPEAARALGIKPSTARVQLHRLRAKIQAV